MCGRYVSRGKGAQSPAAFAQHPTLETIVELCGGASRRTRRENKLEGKEEMKTAKGSVVKKLVNREVSLL